MTLTATECTAPRGASQSRDQNTWAVVLAAGEGGAGGLHRLDLPAQFAAPRGEQTLLQQTVARLAPLVPAHRIVVVVARHRRDLAEQQLHHEPALEILSQPEDSGTGPAVFFALSLVQAKDCGARVIVTPSDQHLGEPAVLTAALERAMRVCDCAAEDLVLIGAEPDRPAANLGWILPEVPQSDPDPSGALRVHTCVEEPPAIVAAEFHRQGALWNTHIMVGDVDTFWSEGLRYLPRQIALFEEYLAALRQTDDGPSHVFDRLLTRLYRRMPPADFGRAVLECSRGLTVVPMRESGWTDCGKADGLFRRVEHATDRSQQVLRAILRSIRPEQIARSPRPGSSDLVMSGFLGSQSEPAEPA
jgi:mannose-1-phosphate guanylyltransferase